LHEREVGKGKKGEEGDDLNKKEQKKQKEGVKGIGAAGANANDRSCVAWAVVGFEGNGQRMDRSMDRARKPSGMVIVE
jgi:hypothetical protein